MNINWVVPSTRSSENETGVNDILRRSKLSADLIAKYLHIIYLGVNKNDTCKLERYVSDGSMKAKLNLLKII